ncbi:MAG: flagellar hook-associated protein FlgK [Nannocystaceae bacterium]|nr:flagellar hook-associated protein FlgK [Nannocystaceae bacterium]
MTSLTGLLQIARSSLVTHQAALSVVSNNTANAGTVGYARREVEFEALGRGGGVGIAAVMRRSADLVERRVLLANSRLGAHQAMAEGLGALEGKFGDGEYGLGGQLDAFFASLRSLATDPADTQLRNDVLSRAQTLAQAFGETAATIDRERRGTDGAIAVELERVNQLATSLADNNRALVATAPGTTERAEQLDRRQQLLGELSNLVEVSTIAGDDGSITVLLQGGMPLVSGEHASQLRGTSDTGNDGLLRLDLIDPSGAALDVTGQLSGGSLGGRLALRDDELVATGDALDQLAYDLATAVNTVHVAGFGTDGVSGREFFAQPAAVADAAAGLALSAGLEDHPEWIAAASTAASASGGNDNLLAMIDLAGSNIAAGGTLTAGQQVASLIGDVGRRARAQNDAADEAAAMYEQNTALLQSSTGVSVDEELVDLSRFERAYQAGARIVQTVERLYDTILQL